MNETEKPNPEQRHNDFQLSLLYKIARKFDPERLYNAISESVTPQELRDDLMEAYFMAVDSILNDQLPPYSPERNALSTLRSLIYATSPNPENS